MPDLFTVQPILALNAYSLCYMHLLIVDCVPCGGVKSDASLTLDLWVFSLNFDETPLSQISISSEAVSFPMNLKSVRTGCKWVFSKLFSTDMLIHVNSMKGNGDWEITWAGLMKQTSYKMKISFYLGCLIRHCLLSIVLWNIQSSINFIIINQLNHFSGPKCLNRRSDFTEVGKVGNTHSVWSWLLLIYAHSEYLFIYQSYKEQIIPMKR